MIAGVDEAGRGPLAGPVVVAAVVLKPRSRFAGLNDSKVVTKANRERLELEIKKRALYWHVEFSEVEEIDRLNILWATMEAMSRALEKLPVLPSKALIDGNRLPKRLPCDAVAIIDGDALEPCISAASILAKTARDRFMCELAKEYPVYGFERHFGYSTPEHLRALEEHGPCPIHRRSFKRCADPQLALELV